jgi:hypothetical protein
MDAVHPSSSSPFPHPPGTLRSSFLLAARFWERRRVLYNLVLTVVAVFWVLCTWPHFRPAFNLMDLGRLAILAVLANLCYSTAYAVELPLQRSTSTAHWRSWRTGLWVAGTLFAVLLESYWILDEIYPDFH